jgi:[acyl-carrier-protein] S-malonyltransferase
MTIAWVFPGQGSQKRGMAAGVLDLPGARERFDQASALLGRDLLVICQAAEPPADLDPADLNDTRNTQPALFVVESLLVDALLAAGRRPSLVAGHSLGELVALYAAGVFDLTTGLELVKRRSELMAAAGGGAMTAVMGFDREELGQLVAGRQDVVIANDNSEAQVVLSGLPEGVAAVTERLRCKRAVPLAVSGAFHSPYMKEAAAAFAAHLEQVSFAEATVPVLSNTDPTPATAAAVLRQRLIDQMTTGVRWRETMQQLEAAGVTAAVEIGPGTVLSGLIRRACPAIATAQIATAADLDA